MPENTSTPAAPIATAETPTPPPPSPRMPEWFSDGVLVLELILQLATVFQGHGGIPAAKQILDAHESEQ